MKSIVDVGIIPTKVISSSLNDRWRSVDLKFSIDEKIGLFASAEDCLGLIIVDSFMFSNNELIIDEKISDNLCSHRFSILKEKQNELALSFEPNVRYRS